MRLMIGARGSPLVACALLSSGIVLAMPISDAGKVAGGVSQPAATLLLVVQRGIRSAQVQIGAGHDEIVAVASGHTRLVATRLTTTCCERGGMAISPAGDRVVFSQEAEGATNANAGLWSVTIDGHDLHRVIEPPTRRQTGSLDIGAVAWSPRQNIITYAANRYSDGPVSAELEVDAGVWIGQSDGAGQRLVAPVVQNGRFAPLVTKSCPGNVTNPAITSLSWAPRSTTIIVSVSCELVTPSFLREEESVVAVDSRTGNVRMLVKNSRLGESGPKSGNLAYVTNDAGNERLWVAQPNGVGARTIVQSHTHIVSFAWSPDEKTIAFLERGAHQHSTVTFVDVGTGRVSLTLTTAQLELVMPASLEHVTWVKDGKALSMSRSVLGSRR